MDGYIFDVKRFAVHDGPGIRTTVFLKGCPLKCVWCHNPESISKNKQLGYLAHKCVSCGRCVAVCPQGAHTMDESHCHIFDRSKCALCGRCAEVCRAKALTVYGKSISEENLETVLLEDKDFYDNSGGGITLSGGECLLQADFCAGILRRMKKHGIHTAVDTCGYAAKEALDKVMPYTDLFLYDIKAFDEAVHVKCTGVSNQRILHNLEYLDANGKSIEIRIPYVPMYNTDQMAKIALYTKKLHGLTRVKLLPYHNYAVTKYKSLGMEDTSPETVPAETELKEARTVFRRLGICVAD